MNATLQTLPNRAEKLNLKGRVIVVLAPLGAFVAVYAFTHLFAALADRSCYFAIEHLGNQGQCLTQVMNRYQSVDGFTATIVALMFSGLAAGIFAEFARTQVDKPAEWHKRWVGAPLIVSAFCALAIVLTGELWFAFNLL